MQLTEGQTYTATRSYTINGVRHERAVTFVAARTQEPEPFIRTATAPDQDRVFVQGPHGATPDLFLAGSIAEVGPLTFEQLAYDEAEAVPGTRVLVPSYYGEPGTEPVYRRHGVVVSYPWGERLFPGSVWVQVDDSHLRPEAFMPSALRLEPPTPAALIVQ